MKTASRLKITATLASLLRASTRPGAPSISERVHAVPRLVRSTLQGTYVGTTVKRLGLVAGAVAYVASPIDLLPEAILPVVGAADDAVVISWAIKAFLDETDRFLAWESGRDSSTVPGLTVPGSTVPGSAVPGSTSSGARVDGEPGQADGVRRAATDFVLESVRKRLER